MRDDRAIFQKACFFDLFMRSLSVQVQTRLYRLAIQLFNGRFTGLACRSLLVCWFDGVFAALQRENGADLIANGVIGVHINNAWLCNLQSPMSLIHGCDANMVIATTNQQETALPLISKRNGGN
jgi:hypothetical protein